MGDSLLGAFFKPKNGSSIVLVSTGGTIPNLYTLDTKTASTKNLNIQTLSDKCVWSKSAIVYCAVPNTIENGHYPDDWYKGMVSTEDSIKKIDTEKQIYYNVSNLSKESGEKIDVDSIYLSPDETHLIFRNKTDGFLWMLRIEK